MVKLRWLGAAALAGSLGCSGGLFSTTPDGSSPGPDGGTGGADGTAPSDGPSSADTSEPPDSKAGDAGAGDAGCVKGSVSFEIQAAPGASTGYCLGAPGSCSSDWLGIRPAGGTDYGIAMPCETSCTQCQPIACANLCAAASRLGDGGAQGGWDGTYFVSGKCGSQGYGCVDQACAPPGDYVASFCAFPTSADAGVFGCVASSSTPTCTEVAFKWPPPAGSATIVGVIGGAAADAGGACCPAAWGLSSCKYPDGRSGQQCHNPALGCASSTTCGQGCDPIVTGRCDAG